MGEACDVIVIGAGVIGLSTSYHLALEGATVVVLEKANAGAGATAAGVGSINIQTKAPGFYLELCLASRQYYPDFLAGLDGDVEFRDHGGVNIAETEQDWEKRVAFMARQRETPGFHVELYQGRAALEIEPALSPHIAGLSYCPLDAEVNPLLLCWAIARTARRLGVRIETDTPVSDIRRASTGFEVDTPRGTYSAPRVVNCAGVGLRAIAQKLGLDVPVEPVRGQLLVTERIPRLFYHVISTLKQTVSGSIIIGGTQEFGVVDNGVQLHDLRAIARRAVRLVPALATVSVVRTWAGIRPVPSDGPPIIGSAPTVPGFYVVTCHSGFTLCPILGRLVGELIRTGRTSLPIDRFAVDREVHVPAERTIH